MNQKIWLCVVLLLIGSLYKSALADVRCQELPVDLSTIDECMGDPDWQLNFGTPQRLKVTFEETSGLGSPSPMPYQIRSEAVAQDTVKIVSMNAAGKETSVFNLHRDAWEGHRGNWIRFYIAQTESYGFKNGVQKINKVTAQVIHRGTLSTLNALEVHTSGENQLGQKLTQTFVITNEISGVGSLLLRREIQDVFGMKVQRTHQVLSIDD